MIYLDSLNDHARCNETTTSRSGAVCIQKFIEKMYEKKLFDAF